MEIIFNDKDVIFVNHSGKQYIKFNIEEVDFSKFIGINFNPIEISYLFFGKVPYSGDMELMGYEYVKNEYILEMTNSESKYTLLLNKKKEFLKFLINNEYFDSISLDSIQYTKNDDGISVPKNLTFSSEDQKIKLNFIVDKSSFNPSEVKEMALSELKDYVEVFDINEIKINLK